MTDMSLETAYRILRDEGAVVNIGQIGPNLKRALERGVRRGWLVKYRGYWNTLSPHFGIGPLKTIYALVPPADEAGGAAP